ncbi:NAD(+) diphosphatase [Vibrio sp. SCSIO 43136]|uniref:NAD(+) diphosphatase n=1 Tax=Vibrio sp. SCSIO 43136 TaxID=2819101 RepID=UPI002075C034|nr:NAD(+) diphosphatase [Vibrio sp. SCSIO 43136]USD65428.1 NAD(+) diphosphatase [Vibrio sp. SCSIO 43136]
MIKNGELAYWCVVNGSDVWLVDGELPCLSAQNLPFDTHDAITVGHYNGHDVRWLNSADIEQDLEMTSLRELLHLPESLFLLVSRAVQFGHMSQSIRFCPQCGGRTHLNHNQLAMQCQSCRTLHYPRIFPCVIVAVRNQDKILLAQHPRHKGNMYTVIAGFVEVGETLEQCVAREVKEETGIDIDNIRYFGSQPWAFPSSLMMGFLADFAGGVVKPDYRELTDAKWFDTDEMPEVAPHGTIARQLIEHTVELIKKDR